MGVVFGILNIDWQYFVHTRTHTHTHTHTDTLYRVRQCGHWMIVSRV